MQTQLTCFAQSFEQIWDSVDAYLSFHDRDAGVGGAEVDPDDVRCGGFGVEEAARGGGRGPWERMRGCSVAEKRTSEESRSHGNISGEQRGTDGGGIEWLYKNPEQR